MGIDKKELVTKLRNALYAAKICSYAQGYMLMREAAGEYAAQWCADNGRDECKIAEIRGQQHGPLADLGVEQLGRHHHHRPGQAGQAGRSGRSGSCSSPARTARRAPPPCG